MPPRLALLDAFPNETNKKPKPTDQSASVIFLRSVLAEFLDVDIREDAEHFTELFDFLGRVAAGEAFDGLFILPPVDLIERDGILADGEIVLAAIRGVARLGDEALPDELVDLLRDAGAGNVQQVGNLRNGTLVTEGENHFKVEKAVVSKVFVQNFFVHQVEVVHGGAIIVSIKGFAQIHAITSSV